MILGSKLPYSLTFSLSYIVVDLPFDLPLAKKHGIKLNENVKEDSSNSKVSFGFYSSLLVFIFFVITLSRILYFSQEFIITTIPASEYYLNYFFESIRNIFEIWKNLITSY